MGNCSNVFSPLMTKRRLNSWSGGIIAWSWVCAAGLCRMPTMSKTHSRPLSWSWRARELLRGWLAGRGLAVTAGSLAAWLCENAVSVGRANSLVLPTIQAAASMAAGKAVAPGTISYKVAALAEGVAKAMFITKLKALIAVAVLLGIVAFGGAFRSQNTAVVQPGPDDKAAAPGSPTGTEANGMHVVGTFTPGASQDKKSLLEGSKAGDRKELVPGIAFRWCPGGKFRMGEGDDAVDVELSKGFWLGETEVTQGQWQKLMGTSPWSGRTGVGARASTNA